MKIALTLATAATFAAILPAAADEHSAAPPRCVLPQDIRDTKPISDTEIVFTMRDGKMWKNTLPAKCTGLAFENGFSWVVRGDEICANLQTLRVLHRGNTCFLGEFSAYSPPSPPASN